VSIRFYMDEQVPSAITSGLRARGVEVLTVQEDTREGTEDPEVLDRARQIEHAMFTRDSDFLVEAARRQRLGVDFTGIVYAHQRLSINQCINDLELIATAVRLEEIANQVIYLPV
jgi:predicted nuclease of predicted toxin-antitoxin system